MNGKLYLVPTPIGNLSDMTFRAVDVLKKVNLILAEDTRVSKKLLNHFEIETRMEAFHEHNQSEKLPKVIALLKKTDLALISDAGSPGISDPGYELVKACITTGIEVVPLPGPTAFVPALTASGLPSNAFTFLGFLPKKKAAREQILSEYSKSRMTLIFYESPYRILETLEELLTILGNRNICIAREISKKFESFYYLNLEDALSSLRDERVAGEIVLVVGGVEKDSEIWDTDKVKQALQKEVETGQSLSSAAKSVASMSGWKKSVIYEMGLEKDSN